VTVQLIVVDPESLGKEELQEELQEDSKAVATLPSKY
jgi:hypothetical protein